MNEQLKLLMELQKLDTEIINRNKTVQQLPRKLAHIGEDLELAQQKLDRARQRQEDADKKKRDKDLALQESKDRIEKLKERTSSISDNKSYNAHLKEIESAERTTKKLEDDILTALENLDSINKAVAEAEAEVKAEEDKVAEEKKKLETEVAQAKQELEEMLKSRARFREPLGEEMYGLYMNLLKGKDGLAVAQIQFEVCSGCNMNIMPQLAVEITRGEDIHYCPQCGRILFAAPASPASDKPTSE